MKSHAMRISWMGRLPMPPMITMLNEATDSDSPADGENGQDRRDQRARRPHARRADAEGRGVDAAHVGADHEGAVGVVGGRPHRAPEVRPA